MDANHLRRLFDDGRHAEAEAAAVELMAAGNRAPETLSVLAAAARKLGHFDTVASALRETAARRPDDPVAWLDLAEVLSLCARWNEALRAFRLATELAPDDPRPLFALGGAQLVSQRAEAAKRTASLLLQRFPTAPETHVFQAHLERTLGRPRQAIAAYRNSLQLDAACAAALLGLAELDVETPTAPMVESVANALASPNRTLEQRAQLEFASARLMDRNAEVDAAFAHYAAANELQRKSLAQRGIHCRREHMTAWVRTAVQRYPCPAAAPSWPGMQDCGIRPIFIVGMPRSGTTLIEQILARHPAVATGGEFTAAGIAHADYLRARSRAGLPWPPDPADEVERRLLADAGERYVEEALALAGDSRFFVDKHPGNATLVGFLRLLFPAAPLIHASRTPLATCWSIYTAYLPASSACFTTLEDIAHYHAAHAALMRHWATVCEPPLIELQYEKLVAEPQPVIRSLLTACGLEWAEDCLAPESGRNAVTSASVDQVRSAIHHDAVDRHRRYERHLGPLRAALEIAARTMSSSG